MVNQIRRILFIALLGVVAICPAVAQTNLPTDVKVHVPDDLTNDVVTEKYVKDLLKHKDWEKNSTKPKHWVVYSDRSNNKTYQSPNKNAAEFDKLDFNEQVRIADVKDGYALVYTEPKAGIQYPKISETAKTRGWIPMANLLLWQSCPVNDKGIYRKALLVLNLDNVKKSNLDNIGSYFSNPETKTSLGGIKTDMTFYFVMKTDPKTGLVLLARQASLSGASNKMLYGWVDEDAFAPWNQRSCLEPTWDPTDVNKLNNPAGTKYYFYKDPQKKTRVSEYTYGRKYDKDKNENTFYRMDPYKTRFPILDNDTKDNSLFKCTTFGNDGRDVVSNPDDLSAEVKKKIEELTKKLESINLVFVIDGTSSMKPYFASAKQAIKQSIDYFDKQKYKLNVGVVIYRDYEDGNALVEVQPLSPANDIKLIKFLDDVGTLGYGANSSPNDHTHTEALFKGLETALDMSKIKISPEHANMMLVIGDCGNALNDTKALSDSQIVKKLVDNNVHLMAYQVRNNVAEPWQLFNSQMSDMIYKNVSGQYGKLKVPTKVKFKNNKLGYDIDNGTKEQLFVGSIRFEQEGKDMEPNILSKLITDNIGGFKDAIEKQIEVLQKGNSNIAAVGDTVGLNPMDLQFLKDRLGPELAEKMLKKHITMATTSYVPKAIGSTNLWKPVIFLSTAEFDNLIERLEPVYNEANAVMNDNNRKPYVDAVKGLLRAMVPDITDAEMDQKGLSEVMNMISGLNVTSDALDIPLSDLQDIHKVPKDKFVSLVNDFCSKFETLRRIRKTNYLYAYTSNDIKYYWIPVENLP